MLLFSPPLLHADLKVFVSRYSSLLTSGLEVAQIFYGLQSSNFAPGTWQNNQFWKKWRSVEFHTLQQLANQAIVAHRTSQLELHRQKNNKRASSSSANSPSAKRHRSSSSNDSAVNNDETTEMSNEEQEGEENDMPQQREHQMREISETKNQLDEAENDDQSENSHGPQDEQTQQSTPNQSQELTGYDSEEF